MMHVDFLSSEERESAQNSRFPGETISYDEIS